MDYKKLAEYVRMFDNTELLASEIEAIGDETGVETIDELADYLRDELDYCNQ